MSNTVTEIDLPEFLVLPFMTDRCEPVDYYAAADWLEENGDGEYAAALRTAAELNKRPHFYTEHFTAWYVGPDCIWPNRRAYNLLDKEQFDDMYKHVRGVERKGWESLMQLRTRDAFVLLHKAVSG